LKIIECVQGSQEWRDIRLGIPTASAFDRIITGAGKQSGQALSYMHGLIAEWITGQPCDNFNSDMATRGTNYEERAAAYYEFTYGILPEKVGFVLRDDEKVGCSPDRFVDDGLLEIKVPAQNTHVGYLLASISDNYQQELIKNYKCQLQGQLYICERQWVDILSYNPVMPSAVIRIQRDDMFIGQMAQLIDQFLENLEKAKNIIREYGITEHMIQQEESEFNNLLNQ
jgi:hypothetical protein